MKHNHDGEVKHTVEPSEEIKRGFARIKQHLQDHKEAYLAGAGCLIVGYLSGNQLKRPIVIDFKPVINNLPTFNNTVAPVITNAVNNGGHMRKIIRCLETGEMWLSVTEAAKAQAKSLPLMSQHLNHPDVVSEINGLHFVIEAIAAG